MDKTIFVPELNIWNNKILMSELNINKTFLKISPLTQAYYNNFINVPSLQSVMFGNTYDNTKFGIFYDINNIASSIYAEIKTRVNLYNGLNTYIHNGKLIENIVLPIDSTSWDSTSEISVEVIPDIFDSTSKEWAYNLFKITYEEYYYIREIKKYKNGESIDLRYIITHSALSEMLLQYIDSELNNVYPISLPSLSEDNRLIDWLFYHWMVNYFYNRKRLCEVQRMNTETHFYIPINNSKVYTISQQDISNKYIILDYIPTDSNHVLLYHKNNLYGNSKFMVSNNENRLYWDPTIPINPGDNIYVEYSHVPFEIMQVL